MDLSFSIISVLALLIYSKCFYGDLLSYFYTFYETEKGDLSFRFSEDLIGVLKDRLSGDILCDLQPTDPFSEDFIGDL